MHFIAICLNAKAVEFQSQRALNVVLVAVFCHYFNHLFSREATKRETTIRSHQAHMRKTGAAV